MSIYGLLFYLLFIYFISKEGILNKFWGGSALIAAILSQQFYLIALLFYSIYEVKKMYNSKNMVLIVEENVIIIFTLIPVALLFLLWGGLTHPSYKAWGIAFHLEYFTAVMIVLGSAFFPFIIFKIKSIPRYYVITTGLLSVILSTFAYPVWVNKPTLGGISGYTFHIISILEKYSTIGAVLIKNFLVFLGLLFIIFVFFKSVVKNNILTILFSAMLIGFTINKFPSERHMLPLIVTGYILLMNQIGSRLITRLWLLYQIVFGVGYFLYITFFYRIG